MTIVKQHLYIDGAWVAPSATGTIAVTDSGTEETCAQIPEGNEADARRAIAQGEIFGPVLTVIPCETEHDAVQLEPAA